MEKKVITQTEKTTRFNEWLKTQPMPNFEQKVDRQRWWCNKVVEFDKLIDKDYEFWIDISGEE